MPMGVNLEQCMLGILSGKGFGKEKITSFRWALEIKCEGFFVSFGFSKVVLQDLRCDLGVRQVSIPSLLSIETL